MDSNTNTNTNKSTNTTTASNAKTTSLRLACIPELQGKRIFNILTVATESFHFHTWEIVRLFILFEDHL